MSKRYPWAVKTRQDILVTDLADAGAEKPKSRPARLISEPMFRALMRVVESGRELRKVTTWAKWPEANRELQYALDALDAAERKEKAWANADRPVRSTAQRDN